MSNAFDNMMKDFDKSIEDIIEIARAATLLQEFRTNSPTGHLEPPVSLPSTPVSAPTSPVSFRSAPVSPVSAPASPASGPVSPASGPVSPVPAPVSPVPAPVSPAPAPVSPSATPVSPAPGPARRRPGRPPRRVHSTAPKSPKSPKSPKIIPSVTTSARNMQRAILANPPSRPSHRLNDDELSARQNSSNKRTRWRAKDVMTRRENRAKAIAARKAGDPVALCALTKERLQKALQPAECTDPALPPCTTAEIKTAHDIVTVHGSSHKDYAISCARLYVVRDVLDAKMSLPVEYRSSVHLVARMAALRAFVVNTDHVITTGKQLIDV